MTVSNQPPGAAYPHPTWCDFATACTSPDALEARGQSPDDVPSWSSNCHWSPWAHVEAGIGDDVQISIAAWSLCNQPPEQAQPVNSIYVRVTWDDLGMTIAVPLSPAQLDPLIAALVEVRDLARASGIPNVGAESEPDDAAGGSGPGWPIGGAR